MAQDEPPPPIAIIGSACRLPGGASNASNLWKLLKEPRDLLTDIPRDRFHWEGVYRPDGLNGAIKTNKGYFLNENIRLFDPQFFGISPAEAANIDPQHRLLLENVYEAIESAGLCLEDLQGTDVGVFAGLMAGEYYDNAVHDVDASSGQILTTGTARSMAANRISYTFDFRGPSVSVDSACSSSLMAVHLAIASLRRGESSVAFACGAHLNLNPNGFKALTRMNMISSDGRSKMFDELADGYGRGEGTVVVCLKPLDAAIRDGDPIECVIRESGTNQDGRTKGITMPNADAQADLIRRTYRSAGLDPTCAASRPSFFEAHGTGTSVGDPLEAQAVEAAFFPPGRDYANDEILYIGSVKTIIGHTEGAAGLAGLLRAALAVRHGLIPPNLYFARMSPAVQPFNKHIHLPTALNLWPSLPRGCPRRASVNSFGFGGSNVHVIVESYTQPPQGRVASMLSLSVADAPLFTPFTFSAVSEQALTASLKAYAAYLDEHRDQFHLQDLLWTLQYKRSQSNYRYAVPSCSPDELLKRLQSTVKRASAKPNVGLYTRNAHSAATKLPRIMGVFTGQGAQWQGMGKGLVERSPFARAIIAKLEDALRALPATDRPRWSLKEELMIDSSRSRLSEAKLAQPLTTAVQILLVDLLHAAGVQLHVVVGHSSGEIAAAYAAGLIEAEDAIRIAYYRGLHSKHAAGVNGERGGMIATSLTPERAEELCRLPRYESRLVVAAYNSPSSTTLAGDLDAIDQAISELQAKDILVRKLQVDKAYHSHHMTACAEGYSQALKQLRLSAVDSGANAPTWFSSATPGNRMQFSDGLKSSYWVENLVAPVCFSTAISTAISEVGMLDLFIEIGPHLVLEQPVCQTVGIFAKDVVAYTSLLRRGTNAVASFSEGLGFIWCRFGREAVNFANLEMTLSNETRPQPTQLKNLPTYPWQISKEYWYENRFLRRRFQSQTRPMELLGEEWEIGASHEAKWRSFLDPREVPWLLQHKLNGVAILPGAAYIAMASTAACRIFQSHSIEMVEIQNLRFELPIVFSDSDRSIETILTVVKITRSATHAEADFFVDFCSHPRNDELMTAARGSIHVRFGFDADRLHPETFRLPSSLTTVDVDHFYKSLAEGGYEYSGLFRNIKSLKRRMDFATGEIMQVSSELLLHPSLLDGLFQASFAAESFPGDSAMSSFQVPSLIRSIKIFPTRCEELLPATGEGSVQCQIESWCADDEESTREASALPNAKPVNSQSPLRFDLTRTSFSQYAGILRSSSGTICQVEGLITVPFRLSTPQDDLNMFSETVWTHVLPHHILQEPNFQDGSKDMKALSLACERLSLYYFRQLHEDITIRDEQRSTTATRYLLEHVRLTLVEVALSIHPHLEKAWLYDDSSTAAKIVARYPDSIDLKCIERLGKAYPSIIAGKETAINVLLEDGYLTEIYRTGLGFQEVNRLLAQYVGELTECSPRLSILEVGAGTGSATQRLLATSCYSHYTFTDISPAFLGPARERFKHFADRMSFRTFDMEVRPEKQGYEMHSFDMIVASNVIHASADIQSILHRLRWLLRPGGYLICVELADVQLLRNTFIMGALSGWWSGHRKDRFWTPALSEELWHSYLQTAGFSGIDAITPTYDVTVCPYRIFCTQAIDERIIALREPFERSQSQPVDDLLILGAQTLQNLDFLQQVERHLAPFFRKLYRTNSLDDFCPIAAFPYAVLSLIDLDDPTFSALSPNRWIALQKLLSEATDVLWVTRGAFEPTSIVQVYANMMVGLGRAIRNELPHLRLTFLDVDSSNTYTASCVAERMLQWHMMGQWIADGWHDDTHFPQQTELAIMDGHVLAPVVQKSKQRNDRYNSRHRRMYEDVRPHDRPVELAYKRSTARYVLRGLPQVPDLHLLASTCHVKMLFTTIYALKIKNTGYLFLGFGVVEDGSKVITLSDATASILRLPHHALQPCNVSVNIAEQYLHAIAAELAAERVIGSVRSNGAIVAICNDSLWMSSLWARAAKCSIQLVFLTSQQGFEPQRATYLHRNSLDQILRQQVPISTSLIVNLSTNPDDEMLFTCVSSIFRVGPVKMRDSCAVFKAKSSGFYGTRNSSQCRVVLEECIRKVDMLTASMWKSSSIQVVTPKEAVLQPVHPASTIVDWSKEETLPVTILPITKDMTLSPEKTYLVVGSSDIAQSICEWMIGSGARYIAVASRDPNHLATWVQDMAAKGATIHIGSMDASDENSVRDYMTLLRAGHSSSNMAMPPFGGVIHLALVLQDTAFSSMSFEDLIAVTDVKAKGSLFLHEQLKDDNLDFFVLTSSISYVVGNPGQANYTCGNAFMVGLAKYRRSQGLAASVVHLGRVTGIGYILRNPSKKSHALNSEDLRLKGVYPISERDLHQIFAEAVLASPANSQTSFEIITGLRSIEPDMLLHCAWAKDPRFGHLLTNTSAMKQSQPPPTISVRQQLNQELSKSSAPSIDNIYNIVKTALVRRLGVLLQMDNIDDDKSLLDLGIDSLAGGEIGSWARKELRVQIPNSLIFGGASVKDVVDMAVKHLDRGWVKLQSGSADSAAGDSAA